MSNLAISASLSETFSRLLRANSECRLSFLKEELGTENWKRELTTENLLMGWVEEEYKDRLGAQDRTDESAPEQMLQKAAAELWRDLVQQIEADVADYKRQGGNADFTRVSDNEIRIANRDTALVADVRADIEAHTVHYDFSSTNPRVASPEGGIFSIHPGRWGRAALYSADQRIHSEAARRILLEPIMFPPDVAA